MIACFDVDYQDPMAHVGAVIFRNWTDETSFISYKMVIEEVEEYILGQFYKRELPCILELLNAIPEPIDTIIVDGYVWLHEEKKGLGAYLYEALNRSIPIIGVAKNQYKQSNTASEVYRGESQKPLYVTSAGISQKAAARYIQSMHGAYRNPTLLKMVDALARDW